MAFFDITQQLFGEERVHTATVRAHFDTIFSLLSHHKTKHKIMNPQGMNHANKNSKHTKPNQPTKAQSEDHPLKTQVDVPFVRRSSSSSSEAEA